MLPNLKPTDAGPEATHIPAASLPHRSSVRLPLEQAVWRPEGGRGPGVEAIA